MGRVNERVKGDKLYSVYMHTVKANNKRYVGQCSTTPRKRWGSNGINYKSQPFYSAIEEFGWENIDHEVIASELSLEEADNLERELIEKYKTNNPDFGYNTQTGGRSGYAALVGGMNPNARSVICVETGETWDCANFCARDLGVNCASLQESLYHGYKCCGKHYKYADDDNYEMNRDPYMVKCIETGQIWNNVQECAAELGIHKRSVARYCAGSRKPKNGLTYIYYTE